MVVRGHITKLFRTGVQYSLSARFQYTAFQPFWATAYTSLRRAVEGILGAGAVPNVYAVSHAASLGKAVEHEQQVALRYVLVGNLPLFRYRARS